MSTPDIVDVVLPPYSPRFFLWTRDGTRYAQGDQLPKVGLASTYAVRLHVEGPSSPPRFLWVQDCELTNPMAHQPITGASVFDRWGRYLGRGGEALEEPGHGPIDTSRGLVERRTPSAPEGARATLLQEAYAEPEKHMLKTGPSLLTHRFHLRPDLEIEVALPPDLTLDEALRLGDWLQVLPFRARARF